MILKKAIIIAKYGGIKMNQSGNVKMSNGRTTGYGSKLHEQLRLYLYTPGTAELALLEIPKISKESYPYHRLTEAFLDREHRQDDKSGIVIGRIKKTMEFSTGQLRDYIIPIGKINFEQEEEQEKIQQMCIRLMHYYVEDSISFDCYESRIFCHYAKQDENIKRLYEKLVTNPDKARLSNYYEFQRKLVKKSFKKLIVLAFRRGMEELRNVDAIYTTKICCENVGFTIDKNDLKKLYKGNEYVHLTYINQEAGWITVRQLYESFFQYCENAIIRYYAGSRSYEIQPGKW